MTTEVRITLPAGQSKGVRLRLVNPESGQTYHEKALEPDVITIEYVHAGQRIVLEEVADKEAT